jgi:hypothetical protein
MKAFKKLGVLPNPEDSRDFKLGSIQPPVAIPASFMPTGFFNLVAMMQDEQPACGGFSGDEMHKYLRSLKSGTVEDLDPRFLYAAEKTLDGVPTQEGTTIRAIGQALIQYGSCLTSLFPDDTSLSVADYCNFSLVPQTAITDAATRKAANYFFLDDLSMNGIKQAIYLNNGAILEVKVGDEWWTAANGTTSWAAADILPLRPPATVVSGHFIFAGAYDANYIYFINSWSQEWGQNGFGFFGENYIPEVTTGLTLVEVPASVKQALSAQQVTLAQQIITDIKEAATFIAKELQQKNGTE